MMSRPGRGSLTTQQRVCRQVRPVMSLRGVEFAGAARSERFAAQNRSLESGHEIVACAVLVPTPMPDWSIDEILAVHIRMHKAEEYSSPTPLCKPPRRAD